MNPLLYALIVVLILVAAVVLLSLLVTVIVTPIMIKLTDRNAKKDTVTILNMLPGTNCGKCGCKSCQEFAQKSAELHLVPSDCPYVSGEDRRKIGAMFRGMSADAPGSLRKKALLGHKDSREEGENP